MLEIFGFTKEPFLHPLSTNEIFPWRDLKEGQKRLAYGVKCGGLICLVGKSGCGKTTLLRCFTSQLEPGLYKSLSVQHTSGTALDLLMPCRRRPTAGDDSRALTVIPAPEHLFVSLAIPEFSLL